MRRLFISGVSTRIIERLANFRGIENLSAGQVSEINKGLNEQVEAFRIRRLEKENLVSVGDALYGKILSIGL